MHKAAGMGRARLHKRTQNAVGRQRQVKVRITATVAAIQAKENLENLRYGNKTTNKTTKRERKVRFIVKVGFSSLLRHPASIGPLLPFRLHHPTGDVRPRELGGEVHGEHVG